MSTIQDNIYYDAPKLFLDDFRSTDDAFDYTKEPIYNFPNWDVVRSYDAFIKYITENTMPVVISFDHDLADVHYHIFQKGTTPEERQKIWVEYHADPDHEKTGYDCLKWLVDFCHDNAITFPRIYIHTMNTIGYQNMAFYYRSAVKNNFIKLN